MTDYAIVITQLSLLLSLTIIFIGYATFIGLVVVLWMIGKLVDMSWRVIERLQEFKESVQVWQQ